MGECGCYMCRDTYKLPAKEGFFYLIHLFPSCDDCAVGAGIRIKLVPAEHGDLEYAQDLPVTYKEPGYVNGQEEEYCCTEIETSMSLGAFKDLAEKCAFEDIDDVTASVWAEEMHAEMKDMPEVVVLKEKKEKTEKEIDSPAPIKIGSDGRCTCNCADKCPLGKVGHQPACTVGELVAAGIAVEEKIDG